MLFNRSRSLDALQRHGLDALIATSPVNVTYFSDYSCWVDRLFREYMMRPGGSSDREQTFAVFPGAGEPALVLPALFAVNAAGSWARDLYVYGRPGFEPLVPLGEIADADRGLHDLISTPAHSTAADALLGALQARGLAEARIGIETEGLSCRTLEALRGALPRAMLKDCSNLIRWLRMVKSCEEISRLRRSAEINEHAATESLALAEPGRPMADLAESYRAVAAEQGADFDHFAFGPRGYGIATDTSHVLSKGDTLYTDFGCVHRGYFSDAGATLVVGEMPAPLRRRYAALLECIEAGAAAMRPGTKSSVVQAAMQHVLAEHGVAGAFPHGHGLGLEVRDYPILVPDNGLRLRDECLDVPSDLPLEPGMVLSLEAGVFAPGVGSLQIEMNFLVTERGNEPLVLQDRTQPFHAN